MASVCRLHRKLIFTLISTSREPLFLKDPRPPRFPARLRRTKMKLAPRASIYPLFTGRRRCISEAASATTKFSFSNGEDFSNRSFSGRSMCPTGMLDNFQLKGVQNLKRSLHGSPGKDDFSELGLPVAETKVTLSKLFTEKREPFLRHNSSKRVSSRMSLPGQSNPSINKVSLKQGNHNSVFRLSVEDHNGVCTAKHDTNDVPYLKASSSLTIEKLPSVISLSHLEEALSVFGKIAKVSLVEKLDGLNCCNVEFERVESRERAVAAGGITVGSFYLPINHLCVLEDVTIRISNISVGTSDHEIHSMCRSFGPMEGLLRTNDDTVDVFYKVKDSSAANCILKRLNDLSIDNYQWKACLLHRDATPTVMTKTASNQHKVESEISRCLEDLRRQIKLNRIYIEDLEDLHLALMHLRNSHATVQ